MGRISYKQIAKMYRKGTAGVKAAITRKYGTDWKVALDGVPNRPEKMKPDQKAKIVLYCLRRRTADSVQVAKEFGVRPQQVAAIKAHITMKTY